MPRDSLPFAGTGRRPRTRRSRRRNGFRFADKRHPVRPDAATSSRDSLSEVAPSCAERTFPGGRGKSAVTPAVNPADPGAHCRATALEIRRSFRRRAASASARSIRRCGALSGGGLRATSLGHQKRVVRRTKVRPRIANSGMRLMPLDRGEGRLSAARRDRAGDPVACAIESLIPANGMKPGGRAAMRVSTLAEIKGFTEARVDTRSAVRPATNPAVRR